MSLLMTSQPIVINRDLACRIGLNEAIVLQQLHYWLNETNSGTEHGGIRWVITRQNSGWSSSVLVRVHSETHICKPEITWGFASRATQ